MNKLTRKQKAFVDTLIANPKMSVTKVVEQTYNVNNARTASVIGAENLAKPNILAHLHASSERAEARIVELVESEKEEIALRASADILDRVHGKATQRVEQTTTGVTLTIDLTSALSDSSD